MVSKTNSLGVRECEYSGVSAVQLAGVVCSSLAVERRCDSVLNTVHVPPPEVLLLSATQTQVAFSLLHSSLEDWGEISFVPFWAGSCRTCSEP